MGLTHELLLKLFPLSIGEASGIPSVAVKCVDIHRLPRGLPRYLILFAPHTFAPHRQLSSSSRGNT